ncbi:MAG: hypothetical protein KAI59_06700 [Planctomycetes bacterium]|nr:hypothetical protein [Planctomycetota bacterium]
MSELDIVRDLAKQALTISTTSGDTDDFFWDSAQRLVHNVRHICLLPDLSSHKANIDRFALYTAAYFCDAGIARSFNPENIKSKSIAASFNTEDLLDICTQIVKKELSKIVEKSKIEKINRIIAESHNNNTSITEAMILSDARSLDDMGAAGILNEFRRFVPVGKGISSALKTWKSKIDYRYWQARLKKSFRFEQVRKLAEHRLAAAENFMNQLKLETEALDLQKLIAEPIQED